MRVTVDSFVRARQAGWRELEQLLRTAHGRPERLGADGVRRLGALYRAAVADLARARRTFPGDPVIRPLEDLVGNARSTIYSTEPRRGSALDFFRRSYWQSVRRRAPAIGLAWALMLAAGVLGALWGWHDPGAASGVVPEMLRPGGPPHRAIGLAADQSAAFSVQIFVNNIRVTFLTFAGGIALGIGAAALLLFNGLTTGAVMGIESHGGHLADVIVLIVPHGLLELSCISVCGAAGMQMGWACVEPGVKSRRAALREEAQRAVMVVLGTAPWLIVAGLVEGFITPKHLPLGPALALGILLAGTYWTLVVRLGRPVRDAPHSLSSDLALR